MIGTIIGAVLLTGVVALIIRSMVRNRKKGKSVICGGSCAGCGHPCPYKK